MSDTLIGALIAVGGLWLAKSEGLTLSEVTGQGEPEVDFGSRTPPRPPQSSAVQDHLVKLMATIQG